MVALAGGTNGGEVISADPTFRVLNSYVENIGGIVHRVPIDDALRLDLEAMAEKVNGNTKLVYVCNPNNPTGTIVSDTELRVQPEVDTKNKLHFRQGSIRAVPSSS